MRPLEVEKFVFGCFEVEYLERPDHFPVKRFTRITDDRYATSKDVNGHVDREWLAAYEAGYNHHSNSINGKLYDLIDVVREILTP